MTTMVKQRTEYDCGVACLAMLTGFTYEKILSRIGDSFDPAAGMVKLDLALERLGVEKTYRLHLHRDWCLSHDVFRRMSWRRRALMIVPSLNIEGAWHIIYYNGRKLYDPSPKKKYIEWKDLMPEQMTIFDETKYEG